MYRDYIQEYNITPEDVLVYLRKSRADDPLLTVEEVLARHESIVDEWAERNLGARVPDRNKYREVVSGETLEDRVEIRHMLKLIESPRYKAILVVEVQRLSRGDLEDCGRLMKIIRYTNTLVITPTKIYDLCDEYDRDSFERELKRGNDYLEYAKKVMRRGCERSVSEGNYIGSVPPYGYDKIFVMEGKRKYPTLRINEEQAAVVRMIFEMYTSRDMGRTNICHALDDMGIRPPKGDFWSPAALKDMLENVHYIGKVKRNYRQVVTVIEDGEIRKTRPKAKPGDYRIFDGKHEAIISDELFYAAREKQGRNHRAKSGTKVRNPLAGLLYCRCGRAMTLRVYAAHNGKPRLICDDQTHCRTGSCTFEEMIELVKNILVESIEDFEQKLSEGGSDQEEMNQRILKSLERKLKDIEEREIAQWEAQANPDPNLRMPPEIFKRINERLLKEKADTMTAIEATRRSSSAPNDYREKIVRFRMALDALSDPEISAERKNTLLKSCIDRITYTRLAPERIKRDPSEAKGTRFKSSGGRWTTPPISLDIKLRV